MVALFIILLFARFHLDYLVIRHQKPLYDFIYDFFVLAVGVLFVVGCKPILEPDSSGWYIIAFAVIVTIIDFLGYIKTKQEKHVPHTRESIAAEVFDVIALIRGRAVEEPLLTLDTQVIGDLHIDGDDITDAILILEDKTGIRIPNKEWADARTIGDIIELLSKYAKQ